MLISLLKVCQEWGVIHGGTWRISRVPNSRLGGQSHLWCHRFPCSTPLSSLGMCWKWGVIHEGTWTIFRVPDRIHGWQGHPWYHELLCLTPRKIPWKFGVYIFIKSESRRGVINGGTWMMLTVPDRRLGGQGHSWCHAGRCLTQRKIPWNICIYIFIRSVSRTEGGGQEVGYLEDVEGSWSETWRTGSSMMSWRKWQSI